MFFYISRPKFASYQEAQPALIVEMGGFEQLIIPDIDESIEEPRETVAQYPRRSSLTDLSTSSDVTSTSTTPALSGEMRAQYMAECRLQRKSKCQIFSLGFNTGSDHNIMTEDAVQRLGAEDLIEPCARY